MTKRVLSVGQCVPDHTALCRLVEGQFDAQLIPAELPAEALETLRSGGIDLVLVNRKLDADYSDGLDVIQSIKADPQLSHVPVMLITNYADQQQLAVQAGAEPGFGKLEYQAPATREKLARFLETPASGS